MDYEISECTIYIIRFHNLCRNYNKVLNKIIDSNLSRLTIEHTHEAMLIKQITEWELFCINIISFGVSQDTSKLSRYLNIKLPERITVGNAHAIINGLNIFSVSNASELKKIARKIVVTRFNPFEQFLKPMLIQIDEAILIRNYIAHKSRASKNKLILHYKNECKINRFIEPGEYLTRKKETAFGPFVCSQLYAWIFMNIAILSWRLLDRNAYNLAFIDEKTQEGTTRGLFNTNLIFDELSKKYNIDTY